MLLKYYFYKALTVNLDFYFNLFKYYIPAGQFIRNKKKKNSTYF